MLLALLAPLCATAAAVLARSHWLAVALRYVVGVLLARARAGLRLRCLARAPLAQAAVAALGTALLALVGGLAALYLATCYSVTALLSVPVLDAALALASVPALRRRALRPDLVFLESYRQARCLGAALLQSAPMAALAALLLAAHVGGSAGGGGGRGPPPLQSAAALVAPTGRALLAAGDSGGSGGAAGSSGGGGGGSVGGAAAQVDLTALVVAAAQALAASGFVPASLQISSPGGAGATDGAQRAAVVRLTPVFAPAGPEAPPLMQPVVQSLVSPRRAAGPTVPPPPTSWRTVAAAVASAVPRPLLALVLAAALANVAVALALLRSACAAAGVPVLPHLRHIARLRGGLRLLAPVADEALGVVVDRDADGGDGDAAAAATAPALGDSGGGSSSSSSAAARANLDDAGHASNGNSNSSSNTTNANTNGIDGINRSSSTSTSDGSGSTDASSHGAQYTAADEAAGSSRTGQATLREGSAGAAGDAAKQPKGPGQAAPGQRLLISSAWHWGSPPGAEGAPRLPLVPRYLLPADGGWLGPGQMARLATLAFERYGCGCCRADSGGARCAVPGGQACARPSAGGAVTALELEHLGGAALCAILGRGLRALPHARRLHLRWCELRGGALRPVLGALRRHPALEAVTLERCVLDAQGAELLCRLLAPPAAGDDAASSAAGTEPGTEQRRGRDGGLDLLRLARCSMSAAAAKTLAEGLACAGRLRAFAFTGGAIEPSGERAAVAAAFAGALRRSTCGLETFALGFSRGCPAVAEALAAAVRDGLVPRSLRFIVLHRREAASRTLAAWAAAYRHAGGAKRPAAPPDAPLLLRAATLQSLQDAAADAQRSDVGAASKPAEGAAARGERRRQQVGRLQQQQRRRQQQQQPGEQQQPPHWLLFTDALPVCFVLDADQGLVLGDGGGGGGGSGGGWLNGLARALPRPDSGLCAQPASAVEAHGSGAMPARAESPDTMPARDGNAEAGSSCFGRATAAPLPPPLPRLVVLTSSDASDAVTACLKGLPVTAIDLEGLELGPRVRGLSRGGAIGDWG